jgi:ribose transport system substrate-binding protein
MRVRGRTRIVAVLAIVGLIVAACGGDDGDEGGAGGGGEDGQYVIGVSNTLVGNGWREVRVCSIKAESDDRRGPISSHHSFLPL